MSKNKHSKKHKDDANKPAATNTQEATSVTSMPPKSESYNLDSYESDSVSDVH